MVEYLLRKREECAAAEPSNSEQKKNERRETLTRLIQLSARHGKADCTKVLLEAGAGPRETIKQGKKKNSNSLNIAITESHK